MSSNFSLTIPNYNGAAFLPDCLDSLIVAIKNCPDSQFEIILVDNGSKDESIAIFQKYSELKILNCKLKIICHQTNKGFAGGVNPGIIASKYPWVVLVNNDLTVSPNWFKIVSQQITPDIATYYGLVLTKDGKQIESEGLDFHYSGKCNNINNHQSFHKSYFINHKSSFIWGAPASLIVYNKNILASIGNFDEDFFAYEEDVDVALRLHKLGHKTLYIPSAISYHLGSGTSSKMGNFRNRMDFKNWIYIIIKNFSKKEIISNLPTIIEQRLRNLSGVIKNTPLLQVPSTIFKLFYEVITHIPTMLKKRHQFQKLLKHN